MVPFEYLLKKYFRRPKEVKTMIYTYQFLGDFTYEHTMKRSADLDLF